MKIVLIEESAVGAHKSPLTTEGTEANTVEKQHTRQSQQTRLQYRSVEKKSMLCDECVGQEAIEKYLIDGFEGCSINTDIIEENPESLDWAQKIGATPRAAKAIKRLWLKGAI